MSPSSSSRVHTGTRLSEQYTVERSQYDPAFRTINLRKSKNCGGRVVDLNADAIAAIESLKVPGQRMKGRVFPRERRAFKVTREEGGRKRELRQPAPGSTRRSNSTRSKASPGTATATRSARGWRWNSFQELICTRTYTSGH
jgi:hypothetical protein